MLQVQKQATLSHLTQYPRKSSGKDLILSLLTVSWYRAIIYGIWSSNQSNSLTGLISVHVVRVFGNGNLEILGQKKLTLNNGDEYIRVSGIVRPEISHQIMLSSTDCKC